MKRPDIISKALLISASLCLAGMTSPLLADDMGGNATMSTPVNQKGHGGGACRDDMQKYCAEVKPGEGRMKDCMKQHEADLSQGCKDQMVKMTAKMQEKAAEMKKACQADLDQYCKDVTPGEGRDIACLHAHNDKISAGCKGFMKSMRMEHHQMKGHMMMENKGMGSDQTGNAPAK
jgi:hypothetical protein